MSTVTPHPPSDERSRLRILLAEDVDLVAEAFEALLSTEPSFEVDRKSTRLNSSH